MGLSISLISSGWFEVMTTAICGLPAYVEGRMPKSFSFKGNDKEVALKSKSFKMKDSETLPTQRGSSNMVLEQSFSFKNWELEKNNLETSVSLKLQGSHANQFCTTNSFTTWKDDVSTPKPSECILELVSPRPKSELHAAAVKLQKVYKSYRTRRNLADCAVVVEELWWKALDFASLKRSSISFFDVKKPETAISRWARARTRAAKVGKGLSKNEKAQKLALQHWLEAIDPRHRYGHNLHLYYDIWFDSESAQPFFYWLDIGDGKEINLDKCTRTRLQHQCIRYLSPKEREAYEVVVKGGELLYKESRQFVNTVEGCKWIFVLSASRNLYVGQKKKGTFQHSSFLSGGATTAAGRLVAEDGVLKAIWPYSGHYLPTEENFKEFIIFLQENNVDLTNVKRCSVDDDNYPSFQKPEHKSAEETVEIEASTEIDKQTNDSKLEKREENITDKVEEPLFEFSKTLPCNWHTGTGPRISCVRDYPVDLQSMALEQVNLSPHVITSPAGNRIPIPSPRPSPRVRLSPRFAYMGIPSPRVSLTLPTSLKK